MIWKRSLYLFSEQIADYFELLVPCYHCDGFRNHFQVKSTTFELLTHLLAFVSIHIWYTTHQTKKTESWALANQEIYTCHQILDCTLLTFRAEITECPYFMSRASLARTSSLSSQNLLVPFTDSLVWPVVTNGKCLK